MLTTILKGCNSNLEKRKMVIYRCKVTSSLSPTSRDKVRIYTNSDSRKQPFFLHHNPPLEIENIFFLFSYQKHFSVEVMEKRTYQLQGQIKYLVGQELLDRAHTQSLIGKKDFFFFFKHVLRKITKVNKEKVFQLPQAIMKTLHIYVITQQS